LEIQRVVERETEKNLGQKGERQKWKSRNSETEKQRQGK